jgi:hypothetical protein
MTDQDKDAFETGEPNELMPGESMPGESMPGEPNELMPGEGDFEGEEKAPEDEFMPGQEDFQDEFEGEEEAPEEAAEAKRGGRRFRFRRGGGEEPEREQGSLRTSHERIRIDDRLSAFFVLICAIGLVGILVGGYLGQYVPKPEGKPLPTLELETFQPTPSPSDSGSPSLAPSESPSASPSAAPSESPEASPSAS